MVTRAEALTLLRRAIGDPSAQFMEGQCEAIDRLASDRRRVLLVQRTGWGKSMVYFLTTRILRDQGAGPTLILSPLLALMRNQVDAARGLGLRAETINATNPAQWDEIMRRLADDQVDLLLVSPERLANETFMDNLMPIAERINFLAIDEAHCISDWGHDFRPDYQRIDRILRQLPDNVAVLATTATANDRVVADVLGQLGGDTLLLRGPLARTTLRLQATSLPNRTERLAWLAAAIPQLPGSGIVYTLTVRDAEQVAAWLVENGIDARAYHGQVADPEEEAGGDQPGREELETMLLNNEIKALVATNALGMGFDKRDLGFVIHFQAPQSIVHYYQQVGRAGRGIDDAVGVLLGGDEDEEINTYFIENAFPPRWQVDRILRALEEADDGRSVNDMMELVNLRKGQIEKVLKLLAVANAAPVIKRGSRWYRTANPFAVDEAKIGRLQTQRQAEAKEVQAYLETDGCLMAFLTGALDDPDAAPCGRCANCIGSPVVDVTPGRAAIAVAGRFVRQSERPLMPRKRWQANAFPKHGWRGIIPEELRSEPGKALAFWRDAGWGSLVETGKEEGRFSDELVEACAEMIEARWGPAPAPTWVTCVPSLRSADLVPDFSARLAARLGLPFVPAVEKVAETERQRSMMNSYQQASNLDGAFAVCAELIQDGPVLLIDDIADSRWSLTVIGALLRQTGSGPVYPCVLALASGSSG